MRKAILPMIASLALCGAAVAALVATNARAELSGRKPVLALVAADKLPDGNMAVPRATGGPPPDRRQAMMGQRREQFCQDLYARKAGELAFLEAKLSLNAKQAPLFARWKQTGLDIAKRRQGDCATAARGPGARGQRLSIIDRQAREEDRLKKRLADIQTERPALIALYDALTPAQKEAFGRGGMHRMARHMMMGMKDRPRPGMGPGMGSGMGPGRDGPMDEPPGPPPAR